MQATPEIKNLILFCFQVFLYNDFFIRIRNFARNQRPTTRKEEENEISGIM